MPHTSEIKIKKWSEWWMTMFTNPEIFFAILHSQVFSKVLLDRVSGRAYSSTLLKTYLCRLCHLQWKFLRYLKYLSVLKLISWIWNVSIKKYWCQTFQMDSPCSALLWKNIKGESIYYTALKVVFGKGFPQKNVAECLFRHILQDTIFLWNGEMYSR